jgi:sugar lactone lactonase YvrE
VSVIIVSKVLNQTDYPRSHTKQHEISLVSFSVISWIVSRINFRSAFFIVFVVGCCFLVSSTAEAHPATGIVVDHNGNVYFSDLETIWKLDANGKKTVFRAGVNGRHVHQLAIDEEGNIYGADLSYNQATKGWPSAIWKMSPARRLTYLLETTEQPPRGMSIWRDRAGNMYLVDQNNHTKTQTLLLRRSPDGRVTTFAGSAYGHKDGRGSEANFGSVGAIAFGPDGSLYLTDSTSVRRVSMDAAVTTIAKDLNFKTREDRPTLFGGAYGSLAGLAVDPNGNVYVADAGNRRLLKISTDGKVEVVYRAEPPFFPNGVFAMQAGDIYVLEVGFSLPSTWSGPRVRKLSGAKNEIVAAAGPDAPSGIKAAVAEQAGSTAESVIEFFYLGGVTRVVVILLSLCLVVSTLVIWKRKRRERRT